jgi:polysaccharide biosynthesis PFTS motif protein
MLKVPKALQSIALLLSVPVRRQRRSHIRKMMRGYRYLKQEGKLHVIEDTVQHLREYQLQIPSNSLPFLLWGEALPSAELIVRQRLSSDYLKLTRALLIASSKPNGYVIASVPKAWRIELQRLGFRLDHLRSSAAWNLHLFKYFCYGIYKALLALKHFVLVSGIIPSANENYIYFCDLAPNNIPSVATVNSSNCIVSWYIRWQGRRNDIKSLRHSVPNSRPQSVRSYELCYQQSPIPGLTCRVHQIYFFLLFLVTLVHSLGSFCKRHWWNIIIYHESITSLLVRLQEKNRLAREYWFHNSRFYPPLWIYELPCKGSKCIYYFYSTNCETFLIRKDGTRPFITPYSIMNWPEYILWDNYQREFIGKCCSDRPRVTIVGPIYFSCNSISLSCRKPRRAIAVFDVQPHRASLYQRLGIANEFYVPDQCIAFLQDILSSAKEFNVTLFIKKKRDIGSDVHPLYRRYVASLTSNENVVFVDPGVSAKAVVECSIGSISMPYTSTAIISREAGIPSAYYVPSEALGVDPSLSHGLQVVCGINNLRSWIQSVVSSDPS